MSRRTSMTGALERLKAPDPVVAEAERRAQVAEAADKDSFGTALHELHRINSVDAGASDAGPLVIDTPAVPGPRGTQPAVEGDQPTRKLVGAKLDLPANELAVVPEPPAGPGEDSPTNDIKQPGRRWVIVAILGLIALIAAVVVILASKGRAQSDGTRSTGPAPASAPKTAIETARATAKATAESTPPIVTATESAEPPVPSSTHSTATARSTTKRTAKPSAQPGRSAKPFEWIDE
ncbi:MAG: hypothetical protein HOW73_32160 [Polyangiaceae bacterium]|nr:hypothetical protein [Polyangiaceae bacterium]